MDYLITLVLKENRLQASARELYLFLGFDESQWARWYKKNIIENPYAMEGEDWKIIDAEFSYLVFENQLKNSLDIESKTIEGVFDSMSKTPNFGRPTKDFMITVDFAKRLSMLARTAKGEEVRKYFIACEKELIETQVKPEIKLSFPHLDRLKELTAKIYWDGQDIETLKKNHKIIIEQKYAEIKELESEQKHLRQLPAICQYCGKKVKNFMATFSHENHCPQNPKKLQVAQQELEAKPTD